MAELKYWTSRLFWYGIVADGPVESDGDADEDPDTKGINGGVTITPTIGRREAKSVRAQDLTPHPALLALAPFEVRLDGGQLKRTATQADVRLVAKSSVLDLPEDVTIWYNFRPHHITYNGQPQSLPEFTVPAPEIADDHDDVTDGEVVVDLAVAEWIEDAVQVGPDVFIRAVPDDVRRVDDTIVFSTAGVDMPNAVDISDFTVGGGGGIPDNGSVTVAKFAAATLVTEAEGIGSNDNDTTIPTSAAVKAYADSVGGGGGGGTVDSVVAGTNVDVDNTDPANPIVSMEALTADDFTDGTTNKAFLATERTKLTGIEALADVTDATNVAAAGAVMESDTTTASMSFVVDEDNMASNSATKVPTQQSVKAYVDANSGGGAGGTVDTVVAGTNVVVDSTDPANPIVSVETLTPADIGLSASATELDFVDGVTSAIQTQLDAKQPLDADLTALAALTAPATKLAGIATGATANSSDATLLARANHTGTQSADTVVDGTTNKAYTAVEKSKLGAITGTNTGDQDLSSYATTAAVAAGYQPLDADLTALAALTAPATKLAGIATGATANDTDANLKARANHTGTQSADTITDGTTNHVFTAADDTKLTGIEALADVTDATNVAAAGAVMKSGSATGMWMGSTLPGSGSTGILYVVTP